MAKKQSSGIFSKLVLVGLLAFFAKRTVDSENPVYYMIPNMLLYTPFRGLTSFIWDLFDPCSLLPEKWEHEHIVELTAEEYTFEKLQAATDNFRHPAVVRGLFDGTPARTKWPQKGYLSSKLGEHIVPLVVNAKVGTAQSDRITGPFGTFMEEILSNQDSKSYLFFPVKSRFQFNGSDVGAMDRLIADVDEVVHDDLELESRVWPGFAKNSTTHKGFVGSQIIAGRGTKSTKTTTGTGWHCAPGNNWFAQVAGTKRWYFMDPKHSAFMHPLRGGTVNMMAGQSMGDYFERLPLKYADIRAGDMLYNPDWYWHTIQNREGLAIGCPIREFNMTLSFQNNAQYTGIILINKALDKVGISLGGYP
mmetsp:Transcript_20925/g.31896  ORF Transcript_20925/g.31896 Transcript_20925/m.31896 type:complete len:362 (+) Transcript_20925:149-1234(+)|eukprot:CAMPEP_0196807594 /NCGR_PEP_ID=MMETSP1362-20130617/7591_1 /TAXON_ID=163516 /ORGANISM="Leptocylindrus danicus, Strain CCMP1856" /LENGTH=361 /DNA_ID=CAMNT_0042181583 /DNA_START=134 /DNA_END=1219 /DNA_ORIENTATION=+